MKSSQLIEALGRVPGAEQAGDGRFRLAADGEGTFYFGDEGERVTINKVREVAVIGDLVEVEGHGQRGCFPCEQLLGFKVALPSGKDKPTRTGVHS